MAETRTRFDPSVLSLKPDLAYADVWTDPAVRAPDASLSIDYSQLTTAASVNGVIDYPTHIQPLWTRDRGANTCTTCHSNPAELDLRDTVSGTGRVISYEELMVGDPVLDTNGQPIIDIVEDELRVRREEPQVEPGAARGSHLIEVLFNQELKSARDLGPTSHANFLNASEKRLVAEWIDLGGQYYNSPRDSGGNLRGVTGLSESEFNTIVHPILLNRCASCHQAVGLPGSGGTTPNPGFQGQRYVLTGQAEGDFNATLSMIGDVNDPTGSYLLSRPASDSIAPNPVHPQVGAPPGPVLLPSDNDYKAICNWIKAGACP